MYRVLVGMYRSMFQTIFDEKDIARLNGKVEIIPENPQESLPEQMSLDWIKENIDDAEILITGWGTPGKIGAELLDKAKNLKLIVHSAGSIKYLISDDFFGKGVRICNTRSALALGVAETTLAMLIASLKLFMPCADEIRKGNWRVPKLIHDILELYGITVGVVAMSEVGKHLLRLLEPFEVRKIVYDPYADKQVIEDFGAEKVELDELCRLSDAIAICAPSTPQTRGMFSREQFAMMKPSVRIINTARGALIDEAALIENLKEGRFYALLDVTEPEPPAKDSPLRKLPNCHLLPHIAGHLNNGCKRQGRLAVDEIIRFVETGQLEWEVTSEAISRMA